MRKNKRKDKSFLGYPVETLQSMRNTGDDVMVTVTNCLLPFKPTNGSRYTDVELDVYVGKNRETIVLGKKALIVDMDAREKGSMPNRIATGWLLTDDINQLVYGDAMLVDRMHL